MKTGIYKTLLALLSLTAVISCRKTLEQSRFEEFELTDSYGMTRKCGVYLPEGMDPKSQYPVIFMEDGLVFKETGFKKYLDSLIAYGAMNPVIVACAYENKIIIPGYRIAYRNAEYVEEIAKTDVELAKLFDQHYSYFKEEFIPYINKSYPVSPKPADRIYFGTSNSADFGITLSMRDPRLFSEFWCYSPVYSNISEYGALSTPVKYSICWGIKEEVGMTDYFPTLVKDIRKRGGDVKSWTFSGGHDREWWRYWFFEELMRRFPYTR